MFRDHRMQLLSLAAMEAPPNLDADSVRDEKVKVLKSIHPIDVANDVVRGQYGPGWGGGQQVPGYRQEMNVSPTATTQRFVAGRRERYKRRGAGAPPPVRRRAGGAGRAVRDWLTRNDPSPLP